MAAGTALILGQEYSFVDAKFTVFGIELFSCSNFVATETQEKTNNYGMQGRPVSRGRGKKEYECSVDLSLKDVERLKALTPLLNLTDIPFGFATLTLDNGVNKHQIILTAFEFKSDGIEISSDDTEARRTYEAICADIEMLKLS